MNKGVADELPEAVLEGNVGLYFPFYSPSPPPPQSCYALQAVVIYSGDLLPPASHGAEITDMHRRAHLLS